MPIKMHKSRIPCSMNKGNVLIKSSPLEEAAHSQPPRNPCHIPAFLFKAKHSSEF